MQDIDGADADALAELVATIGSLVGERPVVVGLGGPISSGKSTFAASLARLLADQRGIAASVVSADGFLLRNEVLTERGIFERKGYPESYDVEAIVAFLDAVRGGRTDVVAPTYSHEAYDVVDGTEPLGPADVVVLEGIVALQPSLDGQLDLGVYLHAERDVLTDWYVERFVELVGEVEEGSTSILATFADLDDVALRQAAVGVWEAINAPNNAENVEPTRERADVVVTLGPDHGILDVEVRSVG